MSKQTYPALLPWRNLAEPGVVLTKRNQILAGYYFRPPDADSQTEDDAEVFSDEVNKALLMFGSGWATWSEVSSYPSGNYPAPERSYFPDQFSRAVDAERRRHFETVGRHYESERAFLICYTPPPAQVSRLGDLLYTGPINRATPLSREIEKFKDVLSRFENTAGGLGLQRMTSFEVRDDFGTVSQQDELVNYLNFCAKGKIGQIMLPKVAVELDRLIAAQEVLLGERPIVGNDFVAVVTINGVPADSLPNIFASLNSLTIPYRFSQRMIYLDAFKAKKVINRYRGEWGQKTQNVMQRLLPTMLRPTEPIVDQHAVAMSRQAEEAYAWASSGDVKFGYYSPGVVLRHHDLTILKEWADKVEETISDCGFEAMTEGTNTMEAWRATLPGDVRSNIRQPPIHTKTAANFKPLSSVWTGDEACPSPQYPPNSPALLWADTTGNMRFHFNWFIGPRSDESGTLVFGPSGSGKSTLLNTAAIQGRRYKGMRQTCFDFKQGMMATALACGGQFYDLAHGGDRGMYAPLAELDTENDIEWTNDYLAQLYELHLQKPPGPEHREAIYSAVRSLAASPRGLRTMSNFVFAALQNDELRQVFRYYTLAGTAGRFLDGASNPDDNSDFLVYETRDLISLGPQTSLAVLLHQFRRFERTLTGEPTTLFIAEAWNVFGHTIWERRLFKWLRELRSKNATVVMDTQSLADAAASPMMTLLIENCRRKIFLPNPAAMQTTGDPRVPGPKEFYRLFGLNDRQIEIIRNARRKRDYYVTGPDGCRLISLGLSKLELAVAAATDESDVAEVRDLHRKYGDRWLPVFLANRGIDYEQETLLEAAE